MKLYLLQQKEYLDFTHPDAVNYILVRANNEPQARLLADKDEAEFRDGNRKWDVDSATCEIITVKGEPEVIMVS